MASYIDWKVGDKVALKEGAPVGIVPGWDYPSFGTVYTIREIFVSQGGHVCLRLKEVINSEARYRNGEVYEPGFRASWFRKVQPRKSDISIFTAMLHDQRQKVDA